MGTENILQPDLLRLLPQWIIAVIALLWAFNKFVLPFFAKYTETSTKAMAEKATEIEQEILQVRHELEDWKRRFLQLDLEHKRLANKYTALMGAIQGFQIYLKEKGVSDFPDLPDFLTDN